MNMTYKILIILIVIIVIIAFSCFFFIKFDVCEKVQNLFIDVANRGNITYENAVDKYGNEYLIEFSDVNVIDISTGEKVVITEEINDAIIEKQIFYNGEIRDLKDNKIYFIVDKVGTSSTLSSFKDVEDYQVVFDLNTYDLESDPYSKARYWPDFITVQTEDPLEPSIFIHDIEELEFLVGENVIVQDIIFSDYYTSQEYKELLFYLN